MVNRKHIALIGLVVLLALAGCTGAGDGPENAGEEIANDTNTDLAESTGASMIYEMRMTEANQIGLVKAQPPIQMEESLERANLIKRYKYLNDRSNVHHVYMLSNDGKVINYQVAQGKVSSVNSKLTNNKQIVRAPNCDYDTGNGVGSEGACHKVVESPQMDGSYGSNGDAIFFFTPDGHYVEYNGIYLVSEEPKQINTEVTLVEMVNEDSDSTENSSSSDGN